VLALRRAQASGEGQAGEFGDALQLGDAEGDADVEEALESVGVRAM
jgi:hypothetical protein